MDVSVGNGAALTFIENEAVSIAAEHTSETIFFMHSIYHRKAPLYILFTKM